MKKGKKKWLKVKWYDHSSAAVWQTLDEVKKWVEETKAHPCITEGYLIYEDKEAIVLSAESDGQGSFGNCALIFKSLICKRS